MNRHIPTLLATAGLAAVSLLGLVAPSAHAAGGAPHENTSPNTCKTFPTGGSDCFKITGSGMFVNSFSGQNKTQYPQTVYLDSPTHLIWSAVLAPGQVWIHTVNQCWAAGQYTAWYYMNGHPTVYLAVTQWVEPNLPPTKPCQ